MKTVVVAESPAEAHLVMGLLEEAGIPCTVQGEMLFGVRGEIGFTPSSLPQVCVNDEDFERAVALIRDRGRRTEAIDAAAPADEDTAPQGSTSGAVAKAAVLWLLLVLIAGGALGGAVVPVIVVAALVHIYLLVERRT